MRYRHSALLVRVLELLVAPGMIHFIPAIRRQLPDDFPAVHRKEALSDDFMIRTLYTRVKRHVVRGRGTFLLGAHAKWPEQRNTDTRAETDFRGGVSTEITSPGN